VKTFLNREHPMNPFRLHLTLAAVAVLGLAATTPAQTQLPVPLEAAPVAPIPLVVPAPPTVKALTLREFADTDFRAGTYSVYLIHPCTNCPVKVCFSLPRCPRTVRTCSNLLELRWGVLPCKRVVVRFLPDGTVSVRG
jgi:hypothetical protein